MFHTGFGRSVCEPIIMRLPIFVFAWQRVDDAFGVTNVPGRRPFAIRIMTSSADLEFDIMDVDTKLAQEYLMKNKNEFHCIGVEEKDEYMYDAASNKIYCLDYSNRSLTSENVKSLDYSVNLNRLADKITDNVDLFCQLEFLIRKKPIQTTFLELKMIIKQLHYQASLSTNKMRLCKPLVMKNDTPLIDLGCFALLAPTVDILSAENTAVACHLFTQLCRSVGFVSVTLRFMKNEAIKVDKRNGITKNKVLEGGCIGVVTTQSDVVSAVNVLLSAPKGGLWGIRRILVQESACEQFKTELAWKTQSGSGVDIDPKLKSLCTDWYVHENKIFLREYVGSDTNRDVVLIESFRTVKELLTLIDGYRPFCVALWSHGVAESNEIAFGITAPMVWVNRYGVVGDPYQVSLAYFSHVILNDYGDEPEMERVRKLQKDWAKLTPSERRRRVIEAMSEVPANEQNKFYLQCVWSFENHSRNFVHVGDSDLVIGVSEPRDVYTLQGVYCLNNAARVIHRLLEGSGFLITTPPPGVDDNFKLCLSLLAEAGLPIELADFAFPPDTLSVTKSTRVIHSSFGTIFAN